MSSPLFRLAGSFSRIRPSSRSQPRTDPSRVNRSTEDVRRLSRQLSPASTRLGRSLRSVTPDLRLRQGTVDTVNAASVDITMAGSSIVIPGVRHLASYTPTEADNIYLLQSGSDLLVLGKLAT